jgi:hypothetical protein
MKKQGVLTWATLAVAVFCWQETLGFVHPGVLNTREELDFVKKKIQAGAEPWLSVYNRMKSSASGSLSYTPHPGSEVQCGTNSNPDVHCGDEKRDCAAAYTHALLWYYSGNTAYAKKSIEIMNAWSAVLKTHSLANVPLQCGWVGTSWARAAEIIRYTYTEWPAAEIQRFAAMLKNAYVPYMTRDWCNHGQN